MVVMMIMLNQGGYFMNLYTYNYLNSYMLKTLRKIFLIAVYRHGGHFCNLAKELHFKNFAS